MKVSTHPVKVSTHPVMDNAPLIHDGAATERYLKGIIFPHDICNWLGDLLVGWLVGRLVGELVGHFQLGRGVRSPSERP